jgi:hypothetical protein
MTNHMTFIWFFTNWYTLIRINIHSHIKLFSNSLSLFSRCFTNTHCPNTTILYKLGKNLKISPNRKNVNTNIENTLNTTTQLNSSLTSDPTTLTQSITPQLVFSVLIIPVTYYSHACLYRCGWFSSRQIIFTQVDGPRFFIITNI